MSDKTPEVNRRKFVAGTAAAIAFGGGIAVPMTSLAQPTGDVSTARVTFTADEFATVEAVAEQIWPESDTVVGGREAGCAVYIDRSLSGYLSNYRNIYRTGISWLNEASVERSGASFADLEFAQQTAILTAAFAMEFDPVVDTPVAAESDATPVPVGSDSEASITPSIVPGTEGTYITNLSSFVGLMRTHIMEGLLSDPVHGGNRGFAGWNALGYPGPYVVYTEDQQQSFEELGLPVRSVADYM